MLESHNTSPKDLRYTTRPSKFHFKSNRCANYFSQHAEHQNGPSYLVSKAIFGSLYETGNIDYREVLYHLLITLFMLTLSTNQQEMFASIMEFTLVLNEKATKQRLLNLYVPLSQTSPPSSTQDFPHQYIRDSQSVVSNSAFPNINFIHDHGYVSVRECIGNLLANGIQVNAFNSGMKFSCEIVGHDVMVGSTAESLKMRNMLVQDHAKYPIHSVLCLPIYGWC
jgi:hypothetical protein